MDSRSTNRNSSKGTARGQEGKIPDKKDASLLASDSVKDTIGKPVDKGAKKWRPSADKNQGNANSGNSPHK
jgi:hypothetical protein